MLLLCFLWVWCFSGWLCLFRTYYIELIDLITGVADLSSFERLNCYVQIYRSFICFPFILDALVLLQDLHLISLLFRVIFHYRRTFFDIPTGIIEEHVSTYSQVKSKHVFGIDFPWAFSFLCKLRLWI